MTALLRNKAVIRDKISSSQVIFLFQRASEYDKTKYIMFIDYKNNVFHIEDVSMSSLAEQYPTPFYAYSQSSIQNAYRNCLNAYQNHGVDIHIHYAVKANTNKDIIKTLADEGAGADVTSGGELMRALEGGVHPDKIIFSGVGKTRDELKLALNKKIGQINVESFNELKALNHVASEQDDFNPNVCIRVNPDVDPKVHAKISTGKKQTKFGINHEEVPEIYKMGSEMAALNLCGIAAHIGSQVMAIETFEEEYKVLKQMGLDLRTQGLKVERMDIGGGLGVDYSDCRNQPQFDDWAKYAAKVFKDTDFHLAIEPGRSLVGQSGIFVTRIIYIKESGGRKFAIVDGAMNDLLRPTLYDAYHQILPVKQSEGGATEKYDVVGPVCETGDYFALDRELTSELKEGDLLSIGSAGAYGHVMASTYNMRPLPAELLIHGKDVRVIQPHRSPY